MLRTFIKRYLRLPADALIRSSAALPVMLHESSAALRVMLHEHIMRDPCIAAKFYSYQGSKTCFNIRMSSIHKATPEAGFPLPPPELLRGYGEGYLESGKRDNEMIRSIFKDSGYSLQPGNRILQFGCAAGQKDGPSRGGCRRSRVNGRIGDWVIFLDCVCPM